MKYVLSIAVLCLLVLAGLYIKNTSRYKECVYNMYSIFDDSSLMYYHRSINNWCKNYNDLP